MIFIKYIDLQYLPHLKSDISAKNILTPQLTERKFHPFLSSPAALGTTDKNHMSPINSLTD